MTDQKKPSLAWTWSLPPRECITPGHILDKIVSAQSRVMVSTTASTLEQVSDALQFCQAPEKTVLIGRHDFRHIQTRMLAAVHLIKEVVGAAVVENRRDRADTS